MTRCNQHLFEAGQLAIDMNFSNFPNYAFYTPNMQNDGHDSNLTFAGTFMKAFVDSHLPYFPNRTLFVVTFDEDNNYVSDDRVLTILLGNVIKPGTVNSNCYNHYSLLRLVEDNWNLGTLGRNDATFSAIDITATGGPGAGLCSELYIPEFSILIWAAIAIGALLIVIIILTVTLVAFKRRHMFCWANK